MYLMIQGNEPSFLIWGGSQKAGFWVGSDRNRHLRCGRSPISARCVDVELDAIRPGLGCEDYRDLGGSQVIQGQNDGMAEWSKRRALW